MWLGLELTDPDVHVVYRWRRVDLLLGFYRCSQTFNPFINSSYTQQSVKITTMRECSALTAVARCKTWQAILLAHACCALHGGDGSDRLAPGLLRLPYVAVPSPHAATL